jgi:gluconate kinase
MMLYLFGLPAAGKNFVGQVLAEDFGFTYYDGDLDLTAEMLAAMRDERPFTESMRDRYYDILIERIDRLRRDHSHLAFGQATFKERHRQKIAAAFPDLNFVLVGADEEIRRTRLSRDDNPVTVEYARRITGLFEPPGHQHFVIVNNDGREEVVYQLAEMLALLQESYPD